MEGLYQFSNNALEQMEARGISKPIVFEVLHRPYAEHWRDEGRERIYSQIETIEGIDYLVRVFVDVQTTPILVKTVHKTLNVRKYWK